MPLVVASALLPSPRRLDCSPRGTALEPRAGGGGKPRPWPSGARAARALAGWCPCAAPPEAGAPPSRAELHVLRRPETRARARAAVATATARSTYLLWRSRGRGSRKRAGSGGGGVGARMLLRSSGLGAAGALRRRRWRRDVPAIESKRSGMRRLAVCLGALLRLGFLLVGAAVGGGRRLVCRDTSIIHRCRRIIRTRQRMYGYGYCRFGRAAASYYWR